MRIFNERNPVRAIALGIAIIMTLGSCANTGGPGYSAEDNVGKLLGTLGGAAIGAAVGGKHPLLGATIGALVGYMAGYAFDTYRVSQKKTAAEVDDGYKRTHGGQLPVQTIVTKYVTKTDPAGLVNRGAPLDIISDIELVRGSESSGQDRVDEELIIYDASSKSTKKLKKEALREASTSGAYSTRFTFKPTREVSQGTYPFKTVLYLNDIPVRESAGKIQIVIINQQIKMAILEQRVRSFLFSQ